MEYAVIHPLDLPEIVASLGPLLSTDSLLKCIRVSKLWYRVLLSSFWGIVKVNSDNLLHSRRQSLSSIQKHALFIRELTINCDAAVTLSCGSTTLPVLAKLSIRNSDGRSLFEDPALVVFIQRHRETLISVGLAHHASDAIMAALEDCPRLESLSTVIQDGVLDPVKWITQFGRLWSRLRTVSLLDSFCYFYNHLPNETITTADWPPCQGPRRIEDLSMVFRLEEPVTGYSTWIVKQCPDLVRLKWVHTLGYQGFPTEELVGLLQSDPTFGKKLEDITLARWKIKGRTFQTLLASLVRLRGLNLSDSFYEGDMWPILRTTQPAYLKTLTVLKVDGHWHLSGEAVQQMLCEIPKLKIFTAHWIDDKQMIEGPQQAWACLELEELSLRLLLTQFSTDPSVRALVIQRYLAQVGQLKKLEVLTHFLPRYQLGRKIALKVKDGLEALKNLRRLKDINWVCDCNGAKEARWMLEAWPLLSDETRSWLRGRVDVGEYF